MGGQHSAQPCSSRLNALATADMRCVRTVPRQRRLVSRAAPAWLHSPAPACPGIFRRRDQAAASRTKRCPFFSVEYRQRRRPQGTHVQKEQAREQGTTKSKGDVRGSGGPVTSFETFVVVQLTRRAADKGAGTGRSRNDSYKALTQTRMALPCSALRRLAPPYTALPSPASFPVSPPGPTRNITLQILQLCKPSLRAPLPSSPRSFWFLPGRRAHFTQAVLPRLVQHSRHGY